MTFLSEAAQVFDIKRRLPVDLIEHWRRSRPTKWLERNPLLALRVHSFPGGYYENQYFLMLKLKAATTLLCMLYALQSPPAGRNWALFSSSRSNSWETLDIKHYILLYPKPYKRALTGDCIPMNFGMAALAELSEVAVEVNPAIWRKRPSLREMISHALNKTVAGYCGCSLSKKLKTPAARVWRKIFRSIEFYKRSFREREDPGEAIVSLAMAFEILLTDSYSSGVQKRIVDRLSLLLKGVRGIRAFKKALGDVYEKRGEYVHSGSIDDSINMGEAQIAFICAFVRLVSLVEKLPNRHQEPIRCLVEG
ncbi:MAG: hypothetical protein HYU64_20615 [Armatimonadetes bacterium]|nr:hypothetical protein [Armatimonadota bacterium]